MTVQLKTAEDLAKMRVAGKLAAEVLEMIAPHVVPGVSTGELDRICHKHIVDVQDAIPAPLNYNGFPKSVCTSVNHVICHGIPSDDKVLKSGDIINIDVTVIKDGFHGDTSRMFCVGDVPEHAQRLIRVTCGSRVLRPRDRQGIPRGAAGAALRSPRDRPRPRRRNDFHHRAHVQCRLKAYQAVTGRWLDGYHEG